MPADCSGVASALYFVSLLLASTAAVADPHEQLVERHPHLTVPKLSVAPTIDGDIDSTEWLGAAESCRLVEFTSGTVSPQSSRLFIGYTDTALFVAFVFDLEDGESPVATATIADQNIWRQDDIFELDLDINHDHKQYFNFVGNAAGVTGDGKGTQSIDKSWDTAWQYAATPTATGWQGELAIPFAELGADTPEPGDIWGFEFVRNEAHTRNKLEAWSFRNTWHAVHNFGHIRFSPDAPAIKMLAVGKLSDDIGGITFRICSADPARLENITAAFSLRGAPGKRLEIKEKYFHLVDDALTASTDSVNSLSMINARITEVYPDLITAPESQMLQLNDNGEVNVQLRCRLAEGDYVLEYRLRSADAMLCAGAAPFVMVRDSVLEVDEYRIGSQVVALNVNLQPTPTASRLVLSAIRKDSGKEVRKMVHDCNGEAEASIEFSVKDLDAGVHAIRAVIYDGDKVVAEVSVDLEIFSNFY